MNHYVYLLSHREYEKYYIGSRSCKSKISEDDYMGSSSIMTNEEKNSCSKIILKRFETRKDAVKYESTLHKKFDVSRNILFWNLARQTEKFFVRDGAIPHNKGKKMSDKQRLKLIGKKPTKSHLEKLIKSHQKDKTIYSFINIETKEIVTLNRYDFQKKYNLRNYAVSRLLLNVTNSVNGWMLYKNKHKKVSGKFYTFYHKDGRVFNGTMKELSKKENVSYTNIVMAKNKQLKFASGWTICKDNLKEVEFTFINEDGRKFTGSKKEFCKKYDIIIGSINMVISKKRNKIYGWSVKC